MHDNADGRRGAFSIQNIARMSLIYNKYPGEWHGPGSISNVLRDLNNLYQPIDNLKVVHFPDGMIYYDKIRKAACDRRSTDYITRKMSEGIHPSADEEKISKIQ